MQLVIRTIKKFFESAWQYLDAIDGYGALPCIFDEAIGRENERLVRFAGNDILVRSGTPDLRVAISSLVQKEYENIQCSDPKVIIDAGANIGTSSIYFARKFPQAKILAIEPEKGNFELLVENVRRYENVVPIKAAIWGSTESRTIQNRNTGHWGYTVSDAQGAAVSTGQQIDCITIVDLMSEFEIEKIDLLKMDIEGGEKDVLENSEAWIEAVDIMTVELHDRICMGCDRAFYLATRDFERFEKHGEKVTAYRH